MNNIKEKAEIAVVVTGHAFKCVASGLISNDWIGSEIAWKRIRSIEQVLGVKLTKKVLLEHYKEIKENDFSKIYDMANAYAKTLNLTSEEKLFVLTRHAVRYFTGDVSPTSLDFNSMCYILAPYLDCNTTTEKAFQNIVFLLFSIFEIENNKERKNHSTITFAGTNMNQSEHTEDKPTSLTCDLSDLSIMLMNISNELSGLSSFPYNAGPINQGSGYQHPGSHYQIKHVEICPTLRRFVDNLLLTTSANDFLQISKKLPMSTSQPYALHSFLMSAFSIEKYVAWLEKESKAT